MDTGKRNKSFTSKLHIDDGYERRAGAEQPHKDLISLI